MALVCSGDAMDTDMSAFLGLSPNNNLKNGRIRASVFMALHMVYIMS